MAHSGFKDLLEKGGFRAFLGTQFLGAFNDSVYQTIVALHAGSVKGGMYVPLVPAVFTLPTLLFSGYSGHLADRVSKRTVLIAVKVFEIAIMLFGLATLRAGWTEGMLGVVFLMGLHAAVFSPAKYGIVPEMLPDRDLSRGNALLEMSTFVAIVLGIAGGGVLFAAWKAAAWRIGLVTLAVALAGFAASLRITRVAPAGSTEPFRWNPFGEIAASTRGLLRDRPLWLAVLGVSWFWFAGVLLKTDLQYLGSDVLGASDNGVALLWAFLAIGIGGGNLLAGRLSGDKVELGLVPLGAGAMGIFAMAAALCRTIVPATVAVVLLAVASGLFVVPLYAYVQQRSERHAKGRVVAVNNFYQTIGMLAAAGLMSLVHTRAGIRADHILFGFGAAMLAVTVYVATVVPDYLVRFVLWMATHSIWRIRIEGQENVPQRGPALLVANHTSQVDGLLIGACVQRFIRFLVWKPYFEMRPFRRFLRFAKAIPVGSGRDAVRAIEAARQALEEGHVVCIFAEGAITRTGNLLPFKRGMEKIVEGLDVPVVPVHLDRLWGSIFSFEGGRFFWKWPKRIPYPVTVSFGAPMPAGTPAHAVRQAIQGLAAEAAVRRQSPRDTLDRRVIRMARRRWGRFAMADSTGRELTYGRLLTAAFLIARRLPREEMTGVLLPSTVAGALVNVAVTVKGGAPVNLNFTAGPAAIAHAIEQCGIRTVVTSRKFLAQANVGNLSGLVYVEDLFGGASAFDKVLAYAAARFLPHRTRRTPDSVATVVFSSGSTGVPKGVMLSHYNLIANLEGFGQLFPITVEDRIAGVLPFFHSFGLTVTIWFPLLQGCGVVYHHNPTDARQIGELVQKNRATFLLSTPTFYAAYTRKCTKEEFASLRFALVGAEKLRPAVADGFREKFGLELLEGYGCTEMSPVVAVNAPGFQGGGQKQIGTKPGTVGHPLPGVAARVVDAVTFELLPPETQGLLLVKGPNLMAGYLREPERTAEALHEGWYVTGDLAVLDDEGFLRITDRLSRFSKIGGEMVPHLRIEDAISAVLDGAPCAVTAVPDEQRGERLAALYVSAVAPAELWRRLAATDMPRLWIPKRENVYPVAALPLLGTGKLDLRALKDQARQLAEVSP
jgi:acyl-[acyl-carrier-protein]-phospholipid O-acyltransferase / long-chain-fatty-acid--[acyl-carrier-protein] ligase